MSRWFQIAWADSRGKTIIVLLDFNPIALGVGAAGRWLCLDGEGGAGDVVVRGADAFAARAKVKVAGVACLTGWNN